MLQDRSCSLACVVERYMLGNAKSDLDRLRILRLDVNQRVVTPPKIDLFTDGSQREVVFSIHR